jgi:glucose-6-phosphate isomerase
MIKINYQNLGIDLEIEKHKEKLEKIKNESAPAFEKTKADLKYIADKVKKYKKYKNVISIGNGGSRTSAWAFYNSLFEFRNKVNFEFLSSNEPELIKKIRKKYSKKDTLILVVSKSGDNINALEPLLNFSDYQVLVVTGEKENTLSRMVKAKNWETILHPEVGGRYSGMTSSGLVPACLMGLKIEEIYAGAQAGYEKYNNKIGAEKNDALKLALYFFELDSRGYTEIFSSIYSTALFAFFPLLVQLIHESTGKEGKGQTIFGDYSPESQHHTNQRFFGGRKNAIGLFMGVEKHKNDIKMKVSQSLAKISYNDIELGKLSGILGSDTMKFDMQGVVGNAIAKKIPACEIWVDEVSPKNMGEFMVFWHYFTMYSALLRGQNPFDQPEVEDAKIISFNLRMKK